jgi:hypothetical protein
MASIPPALLDRMEIIQIPGYTQEEKVAIAMQHLLPKQIKENGLTLEQIQIPEDTVKLIGKGGVCTLKYCKCDKIKGFSFVLDTVKNMMLYIFCTKEYLF